MKIRREWGTFVNSNASLVNESIEFAGKKYTPNRKLAYIKAELCHSIPLFNSKRRGFTPQTLANSYKSVVNQLIDFEHRLKFYGATTDKICGAIAAVEFPEKVESFITENKPVPMSILFALFRKAEGVEEALEEMAEEVNPWKTSMECEYSPDNCALWDGEKATAWTEAPIEMRECVKQDTVDDYASKPLYLLMGGMSGEVLFTGGALTKWPADKAAKVIQVAANESGMERKLVVNAGWKSKEDWQEAASNYKEDKGSEPVKKSVVKREVKTAKQEEGTMFEKLIAFLKAQAESLKEKDEAASKQALELASELANQVKVDSAEEVIAARIKNGDLVPKAKHEEAVKTAKEEAVAAVKTEVEAKAKAEQRRVETIANRMKLVTESKLDPKFALGKDRTIESVVASIPMTDEGDKMFEDRLSEWTSLRVATGQGTASDTGKGKTVPLGGGEGTDNQKPGYAFI